jgi:hypothetical protein
MSRADVKQILGAFPSSAEGGVSARVYDCGIHIPNEILPGFAKVKANRSLCGAIYYFQDSLTGSMMDRVMGEILCHFCCSDPTPRITVRRHKYALYR